MRTPGDQDGGLLDQAPRRLVTVAEMQLGRTLPRHPLAPDQPRRTPEAQADIAAARAHPGSSELAMEVAMQEIDRAAEQALREHREAPTAFRAGDGPLLASEDPIGRHGLVSTSACQRDDAHPIPSGCVFAATSIDAVLSNAALADTPAVREMGGPNKVPLLPPHEIGGPSCNHVHWTLGCRPCAGWAVANGVEFARHMNARSADTSPPAAASRQPYAALDPANLPPGAVLLTGTEAERYRALQAAARAAQQTAQAHQAASIALRDTIQQVCAGLAPGKEG